MHMNNNLFYTLTLTFFLFAGCKKTHNVYYKNGNLKFQYETISGKRDGNAREYYESGKLKSEMEYLKGNLEGVKKNYFENGILNIEINYANGKANGIYKVYYN